MSREYKSHELANVQNYLMYKGHACPHIIGDTVQYLERLKGQHRVVKSAKIDDVLEEIHLLKTIPIEHYSDKSEYNPNRHRYGIGYYQVADIGDRLMVIEDFKIALIGLYDD